MLAGPRFARLLRLSSGTGGMSQVALLAGDCACHLTQSTNEGNRRVVVQTKAPACSGGVRSVPGCARAAAGARLPRRIRSGHVLGRSKQLLSPAPLHRVALPPHRKLGPRQLPPNLVQHRGSAVPCQLQRLQRRGGRRAASLRTSAGVYIRNQKKYRCEAEIVAIRAGA